MKNSIIEKVKDFGVKHKKELIITGFTTGVFTLGYCIGSTVCSLEIADGLDRFDKLGFVDWKIPDGDGFKVVEAKELAAYITEHSSEIKAKAALL